MLEAQSRGRPLTLSAVLMLTNGISGVLNGSQSVGRSSRFPPLRPVESTNSNLLSWSVGSRTAVSLSMASFRVGSLAWPRAGPFRLRRGGEKSMMERPVTREMPALWS